MNVFKTLSEARSAFEQLETETADLRIKAALVPSLETELAETRGSLAGLQTEYDKLKGQNTEKDGQIAAVTAANGSLVVEVATLKNSLETLEKGQKSVKQQARELVAASGGPPLAVDQAEISKMQVGSEKELKAAMLAEHDPDKLAALYKQYNENYRPKKK
jgi:chromosome segregation ATPase